MLVFEYKDEENLGYSVENRKVRKFLSPCFNNLLSEFVNSMTRRKEALTFDENCESPNW